jgi:hypothetical protein
MAACHFKEKMAVVSVEELIPEVGAELDVIEDAAALDPVALTPEGER